MIAEAAAGAGAERAKRRLQAQKQQQTTMMTNDTMKAAPAMLKAHPDMDAPEMEAALALFSCVRYWSSDRSG